MFILLIIYILVCCLSVIGLSLLCRQNIPQPSQSFRRWWDPSFNDVRWVSSDSFTSCLLKLLGCLFYCVMVRSCVLHTIYSALEALRNALYKCSTYLLTVKCFVKCIQVPHCCFVVLVLRNCVLQRPGTLISGNVCFVLWYVLYGVFLSPSKCDRYNIFNTFFTADFCSIVKHW